MGMMDEEHLFEYVKQQESHHQGDHDFRCREVVGINLLDDLRENIETDNPKQDPCCETHDQVKLVLESNSQQTAEKRREKRGNGK
jgi:hypothetical protein